MIAVSSYMSVSLHVSHLSLHVSHGPLIYIQIGITFHESRNWYPLTKYSIFDIDVTIFLRRTCLCIPLTVQLWTSTTIGSLTALITFISFWIYVTRCRAFLFSPPLDTCLKQICKCSEVLGSQWFEVQIETINCLILWQLQRFCCLIIVKPSFVNYFR